MSPKVFLLLFLVFLIPTNAAFAADATVSAGKVTVHAPKAEANKGYAIGIYLSNTCINLVKAGSKTCPSYETLAPMFDNSLPQYSGIFKKVNGFYQRDQSDYKKTSMGWYQYDPVFRIFVDPPKNAKMPLILIETRLPEYHLAGQFKISEIKNGALVDSKAVQTIRSYSHTRYVDDKCENAIITAANWKTILPDTINYMKNNCDPNSTRISTLSNVIKDVTVHNVATSAKYKLDEFYKDVKLNCTKSYQACKTVDNRQVTTQSDSK